MFELKRLSLTAVAHALERAEQYRLLNEPWAAESICLDVLAAEPGHQHAVRTLLLARTDQFQRDLAGNVARARECLAQLTSEYDRAYYAGIICERRAKAKLSKGQLGASDHAYENFRRAMDWYEKAEALRPPGNDDAVLRWNACARIIQGNGLIPSEEDRSEQQLE